MQHHAYYIEGSPAAFEQYKQALRPLWAARFERFGIDEARELTRLSSLKNFDRAVFLVAASSITSEAQQALLKLFEEPQEGTTFVVLLPHGSLVPTLRSRMLAYSQPLVPQKVLGFPVLASNAPTRPSGPDYVATQAAAFLKMSGKERSDEIAKMLKDDDGVKERVLDLVNALEAELAGRMSEPNVREALQDLSMVRDYLRDRSPSLKMLLEHLALALPNA